MLIININLILGCPKCFEDRKTLNRVNQKTMGELYNDTLRKVNYLKSHGFIVVQKWECELKRELEEDEEMKRFFDEHKIVDPLQPRDAFTEDVPTQRNYFMNAKETRRLSKY